jgi:hypothetical protein
MMAYTILLGVNAQKGIRMIYRKTKPETHPKIGSEIVIDPRDGVCTYSGTELRPGDSWEYVYDYHVGDAVSFETDDGEIVEGIIRTLYVWVVDPNTQEIFTTKVENLWRISSRNSSKTRKSQNRATSSSMRTAPTTADQRKAAGGARTKSSDSTSHS